ncbi:nuclear transport factor 2 family protein [Pseudoalteromonas sp. MQS005]|uniref:nuclear transport factor 2 family protein n=1 Tax=Pseudoalteromonas sp. MQS005 TaxID=1854052 RepID=UPI0007E51372|nr:nuclear transport factor 2 family protein [Pseudoalteromonas sp. MQS005]
MKPSFIIYACLFAAFTLNCHAIEQSASSNNAELTQPEKVQPQQDALDTLTQEANIPKQPDVKRVTADDSKVLGSESTKPVEQPKSKVDKAQAVVEAEQAVTQAKEALTARQQAKAKQSRESLAVIEQLVKAYNARNIEEFIRMYDEDVEFYIFPNELLFKGKEKLIARYGIMFKKLKCLHSSPIKRIVHGDIVIDHELSETCSNDPNVIDKRSELISSYQIKDGKVVRVLFFR